jgi:hypothetical protein
VLFAADMFTLIDAGRDRAVRRRQRRLGLDRTWMEGFFRR